MFNLSFIPSGDKSWDFFLMADTKSRLRTKMGSFGGLIVKADTREQDISIYFCVLPLNRKK